MGKLLVEEFVEAQVKTWKTRFSKEEEKEKVWIPVITICMEPGSGGSIVAEEIAKQLDFDFYDESSAPSAGDYLIRRRIIQLKPTSKKIQLQAHR